MIADVPELSFVKEIGVLASLVFLCFWMGARTLNTFFERTAKTFDRLVAAQEQLPTILQELRALLQELRAMNLILQAKLEHLEDLCEHATRQSE